MKDLKEYIEESLLDDFDAINDKVSNAMLNKPLALFYSTYNSTKDWNEAIRLLLLCLKTSEAKELSNFKKPRQGRVTLCITDQDFGDAKNAIYLYFNKRDILYRIEPPLSGQPQSNSEHSYHNYIIEKPYVTIYPNRTQENKPSFVYWMNWSKEQSHLKHCFMLNEKQSDDIITCFVSDLGDWGAYLNK